MLRQISGDGFPRFAEVGGLVNERIAVVHQMEVDADVGSGWVKSGRRDAGDRAPGRQAGNALSDIRPGGGAVFCVPNLAVVGAGPDEPLLDLRRCDRKDDFAVVLPEIVSDDATGGNDMSWILGRQIRAGARPR